MSDFSFAFITPSYELDFQRCKLLCWSIKKFVSFPVKHYIIVDKRDRNRFQQLADASTVILTKEEILPAWIRQVPFFKKKNIWLNLRGYKSGNLLLRGWLVQQIIKLAAATYVEEEVSIFADSDVALVKAFEPQIFINDNRVRLFRVENSVDAYEAIQKEFKETDKKWKDAAKKLLGLPQEENYYDLYIAQMVTWRRSTLIRLYECIEKNFQQDWLEVICGVKDLSEYILYGIFANYVLGEDSGHFDDCLQKNCLCYWQETPMSDAELKEFFREARSSGRSAVMISAKSSMNLSVEQFQSYLASAETL